MEVTTDTDTLLQMYRDAESDDVKLQLLNIMYNGLADAVEEIEEPDPMGIDEAREYFNNQAGSNFGAVIKTPAYEADLYVSAREDKHEAVDHFDCPDGWYSRASEEGGGIEFLQR